MMLNHMTTPRVTIASAVAASCAALGVMKPRGLVAPGPQILNSGQRLPEVSFCFFLSFLFLLPFSRFCVPLFPVLLFVLSLFPLLRITRVAHLAASTGNVRGIW